MSAEEQSAKEAEILRQKELEAQRLNTEIQQEADADLLGLGNPPQSTEEPVSSLTSSLQKAAPFASSLRAAAGSTLAAAAAKASSLAQEASSLAQDVKKDFDATATLEDTAGMRNCAGCSNPLARSEYSRNQWAKGSGISKCKACISGS